MIVLLLILTAIQILYAFQPIIKSCNHCKTYYNGAEEFAVVSFARRDGDFDFEKGSSANEMRKDKIYKLPPEEENLDSIVKTIAGGQQTLFQDLLRLQNVMIWRPHKPKKLGNLQTQRNFFDNSNPDFRVKSPRMTSEGFALTILKNSRKRNKPVLWNYALRKYKEMDVPKFNVHYEAALTACSKLGLYRDALEILLEATREAKEQDKNGTTSRTVYVNEGMIFSVVKACVRASRKVDKDNGKRILNYAKSIVLKSRVRLVSYYV